MQTEGKLGGREFSRCSRQIKVAKAQMMGRMLWQVYWDGMAKGTLTPERATEIREFFEKTTDSRRECSIPDLPTEESIQATTRHRPNQAKSK